MCLTYPFLTQNTAFLKNYLSFKKNILQFIRPSSNSENNCRNPKGHKKFRQTWFELEPFTRA